MTTQGWQVSFVRREAFQHPNAPNDPAAVRAIYSTGPVPQLQGSGPPGAPAACVAYAVAVYDPDDALEVAVKCCQSDSLANVSGAEHAAQRRLSAACAAKPGCVLWALWCLRVCVSAARHRSHVIPTCARVCRLGRACRWLVVGGGARCVPDFGDTWKEAPVRNAAQVLTGSVPRVQPVQGGDSFAPREAEWAATSTVLHVDPEHPDGATEADSKASKSKAKRSKARKPSTGGGGVHAVQTWAGSGRAACVVRSRADRKVPEDVVSRAAR